MTAGASANPELVAAVQSAAAGDPWGWENLTDHFASMIMSIARSCQLNEIDVADVHQTTWLRLVETIDTIEDPEALGSWLETTTKHESLRVLRARSMPPSLDEPTERGPIDLLSSSQGSSLG
jgi:DNA-directed RNA polymerase specialized sigma24 family protein